MTRAVRTLLDHEVDGLLVSTAPFGAEQFNELLDATPCVFIDELAPGAGAANVVLENVRGVELLVDHVVEHGHERIAFLGGPNDRTSGHERLRGVRRRRCGATDSICLAELVRECEWTIASGFEHSMPLLDARNEKPTALVTASGELGLGALAAARRERGRDPGRPGARVLRRPLLCAACSSRR